MGLDAAVVEDVEGARERLFRLGPRALTDAELLALLFQGGARTGRAQALAAALLAAGGGLKALAQHDPHELSALGGLGQARAAQVLAALELGRRTQRSTETRPRLRTPQDIHGHLAPALGGLRREVFHVLCLNARNTLLLDARVAEGSTSSCPVDPREVFAAALSVRASAIVLAHNHPSGDPEPSVQDVGLTRQLCEAGRLLGIRVLDHVVVGDGTYASLLERGLMPAEGDGRGAWVAGR